MSRIRNMIDAAREGNAVEFEKVFGEDIRERLGNALGNMRADTYRSALGLQEMDGEDCDKDKDDDEDDNKEKEPKSDKEEDED